DGTRSDIGWHGGPGGFLCSHPERPPLSPDSLWVGGTDGIAELTWSSRPEADLAEYRLYRGTMPGFWTPGNPPHRIYGPADTSAQDTLLSTGGVYYYVVTAVDTAGLESDASPEGMFVETGVFEPADPQSPVPREPGVISAYPNPFNVGVALVINLLGGDSRAEAAAIEITDVLGRLVRRLAVPRESPGQATVVWDGRTEYGRVAASGVYFARLTAAGGQLGGVHKLVLVR
ncbi:MAG: FlgD immunoglobulin-like domain containing protein, partial [Candidatus Zixiibacteriota bacterium]